MLIVILQVSFSRSAFVIPPQGRNKLIHQLSMHRKHIMFRANDYAALQTNGSIILSPKSECRHILFMEKNTHQIHKITVFQHVADNFVFEAYA